MTNPIITAENIRHSYTSSDFTLRVDSIEFYEGETVFIAGPNGSGKSTLLRILGLLEEPAEGSVRFNGNRATPEHLSQRRQIATVLQQPYLFNETVELAAARPLIFRGIKKAEAIKQALDTLAEFGLDELAQRSTIELSGGEARRLNIVQALITDPKALLMDEPATNLDAESRAALGATAARWAKQHNCVLVIVSHESINGIRFDRHLILNSGRLLHSERDEQSKLC